MSDNYDDISDEDLETIEPPVTLKHLVTNTPGRGGKTIDMDAIERAEQAMENLSVCFGDWMNSEIEALRNAHARAREQGLSGESREELFRACHDLRGEADTLGFPLVGQAAGTLADLLALPAQSAGLPLELVEAHLQAIYAMLREDARGTDNKTAIELVNVLREAAHKVFRQAEEAEAPEPGDTRAAAS